MQQNTQISEQNFTNQLNVNHKKDTQLSKQYPTREGKLGPIQRKKDQKPPKTTQYGKKGAVKSKNQHVSKQANEASGNFQTSERFENWVMIGKYSTQLKVKPSLASRAVIDIPEGGRMALSGRSFSTKYQSPQKNAQDTYANSWIEVYYDGKTGWVSGELIKHFYYSKFEKLVKDKKYDEALEYVTTWFGLNVNINAYKWAFNPDNPKRFSGFVTNGSFGEQASISYTKLSVEHGLQNFPEFVSMIGHEMQHVKQRMDQYLMTDKKKKHALREFLAYYWEVFNKKTIHNKKRKITVINWALNTYYPDMTAAEQETYKTHKEELETKKAELQK